MARTTSRRRHPIRPSTVRVLKICGFRYSVSRDAYVLRVVGGRFGPVFVVRPGVDHHHLVSH